MTQQEFLLMLTKSSLWGRHLQGGPLDCNHYRKLMYMADQQTVRGLVSQTLIDPVNGVTLGRAEALETLRFVQENKEQNKRVQAGLAALVDLLDKNNIHYVVVKGQTIECLYPIRHLRISGDVDFYVIPQDFSRAKELFQNVWNVVYEEGDANMHLEFVYEQVVFEMHYLLLDFASDRVQRSFDRIVEQTRVLRREVSGVNVPVFAPEFELIYTFLHLYHHFIELGIGVRHLCDMAILCHYHFQHSVDADLLKRELDELGFTRAFTAFGAVYVQALDLPDNEFPLSLDEQDFNFVEPILSEIFLRGNMGTSGRTQAVRSGWAYHWEALRTKFHLYRTFYSLAPLETRALLVHEIPAKIMKALKF